MLRSILLQHVSDAAVALDLDVAELVLVAGLLEDDCCAYLRLTVDDRLETLAALVRAPTQSSPLGAELLRRKVPWHQALPRDRPVQAMPLLEVLATAGEPLAFRVWSGGGTGGAIVGDMGELRCETVVGGRGLERILELGRDVGAERRQLELIGDIHPLISRAREMIAAHCFGRAPQLTLHYRDVAISDALRLYSAIAPQAAGAVRLGRFVGTMGASQLDVLELCLRPRRALRFRFGVELGEKLASPRM